MHKNTNTRICLLGSESAGKTCFIAGLGILAEPPRKSDFQVSGRDTVSQTYLNELVAVFHLGRWPKGTTETRMMELDVLYRGSLLQLSLLDYRGEEFRRAFHNQDETRLNPLWAHLEGADVVLIMLDPDVDIEQGESLDEEEEQRRHQRLNAILQSVIQLCHAQIQAGKRTAAPEIAVLLSKRDKHPDLNNGISPREFFKERAPHFLDKLDDWSQCVGVFAVSAVGTLEPTPDNAAPLPPKDLNPKGYDELFKWIVWRKGAPKRKKLVKTASLIVGTLTIITVVWWAQIVSKQNKLQDNARASVLAEVDGSVWFPTEGYKNRLDDLVDAELRRLRNRLDASPGLLELKEIAAAATDLTRCKNSKHHEQARALLPDVQRVRRQTMFAAVKSASDGAEPGFDDAAAAFHREFPQGKDADEVLEMQQKHRTSEQDNERKLVREIRAGEFRFLAKKADAIAIYILKHGKDDLSAEEMRRAEKLARRLAAPSTYTVRLLAFGVFSKKRDHKIEVLQKGTVLKSYNPEKATSSNWGREDASFQVTWEPGDLIEVKLWSLEWSNKVAASEFDSGPLSLGILCGSRTLLPGDGWSSSDFSQGPFIKFELDGFTDDDWRVLRDWVLPGNKW